MNEIYYQIGGKTRPSNDKIARILLKLNKLPLIRSLFFVKNMFISKFNLRDSTSYNKDFYSTSDLLEIGQNVGLADTFIIAYAPVTIGDNCSFSFRNMIITSTHDIENFSTVIAKPIKIGKNCWITSNVTILPGVTIGDSVIIGAGSVVTKDIPGGVFAAGNPCRVIHKIDFIK